MKYTLRAGQLSEKDSGHTLARLRGTIPGQSRQVSGEDGGLLLRTEVRLLESSGLRPCDVRLREYVMFTVDGETLTIARPGYSEHDDPDVCGWPANHMPRVDHAALYFGGRGHMLVMRSAMRHVLRCHLLGEHRPGGLRHDREASARADRRQRAEPHLQPPLPRGLCPRPEGHKS